MSEFIWAFGADLSEESEVGLRSAKFGDGYQQRYASGINNLKQVWSGTITKPVDEIRDIVDFLEDRVNGQSFTFTPADSGEVKVICTKWSRSWKGPNVCTLSLTLERVYE